MDYNSDYDIRLAQLEAMGGDMTKHYDSVYEIDLEILRLTEEGGGSPFDYDSSNGSISNKAFSPEGETYVNSATGQNALALGQGNTVSGEGSAVIGGQSNTVTGDVTTCAGGYNNTFSGSYSFGGGQKNTLSGNSSFVAGRDNTVTAKHAGAMGRFNDVNGEGAFSIGYGQSTLHNTANGRYSLALGCVVTTHNDSEVAMGSKNISHSTNPTGADSASDTQFSVGVKKSQILQEQTNGLEIMQNGDMYIYGIGGYDGKHIKTQTGYESTKTLQEAFSGKSDKIAATVTYDESTDTYDFSNLNSITEVGNYNISIERLNSQAGFGNSMAQLTIQSMGGGMATLQFVAIFNQNATTSSFEYFMKIRVGMGGQWQEYPGKIFIAVIDDSTATTTSTYSSTKIESLISALETRIAALEGN